jgi:hypothetical protein
MKNASKITVAQINSDIKRNSLAGSEKTVAIHRHTVANAFIQAQQRRNDADYKMDKEWKPVEVATNIASVTEAFETWDIIRDEPTAQAYLVSLLGTREGRGQPEGDTAERMQGSRDVDRL